MIVLAGGLLPLAARLYRGDRSPVSRALLVLAAAFVPLGALLNTAAVAANDGRMPALLEYLDAAPEILVPREGEKQHRLCDLYDKFENFELTAPEPEMALPPVTPTAPVSVPPAEKHVRVGRNDPIREKIALLPLCDVIPLKICSYWTLYSLGDIFMDIGAALAVLYLLARLPSIRFRRSV